MLYLAEVLKKSGFMGAKTELKLLARQQSDQNWVALPGDELISTDAANDYGSGVLVLVELGAGNQIQGIQDATRQLIGILKNFSKMKEKFVSQEEEIEGWKQSLIYQSQELTRREVDMESRAEELSQWESESEKIEQQRQEFEDTRSQILELKDQIEADRQQLEEGWGKLQQSQKEFEHLQQSNGASLNDSQMQHIESLISQLESAQGNGNLGAALDSFETRLVQAQQSLAEDRQRLEELNQQVKSHESSLVTSESNLQQAQAELSQELIAIALLESQLEQQKSLQHRLKEQEMFYDSLGDSLREVQASLVGDQVLNVGELWDLDLGELQAKTEQLQQELTKLKSFVADQEEELSYQKQAVDEMRQKFENLSEYERLTQEADLEQEEQQYDLLNETLEGQRKSLRDRQSVLETHEQVLEQRQNASPQDDNQETPDLSPALSKFKDHCATHRTMLESVNEEIQDLSIQIANQHEKLKVKQSNLDNIQQMVADQLKSLTQQKLDLGICQGKVEVYQAFLTPMEEQILLLRQSSSGSEDTGSASSIVRELKQSLMNLGEAPEPIHL